MLDLHHFEVPEAGKIFPPTRSAIGNGLSKDEVAWITRTHFKYSIPRGSLVKVEAYMKEKGCKPF